MKGKRILSEEDVSNGGTNTKYPFIPRTGYDQVRAIGSGLSDGLEV